MANTPSFEPTSNTSAELPALRWLPAIHQHLLHLLARPHPQTPVAVFDCDNTCIRNDIGEALHRALAHHLAYPLSDAFFRRIPPPDGQHTLRDLWDTLQQLELDSEPPPPARTAFTQHLIAAYYRHYQRAGRGPTYQWVTQLLAGMRERTLSAWAQDTLAYELDTPVATHTLQLEGEPTITWDVGIEIYPEITRLMHAMKARGWEVWLVSASNRWAVEAVATHLDIPSKRVLAHDLEVQDGILTDTLLTPITFRQGKVDAIQRHIGRQPVFAIGDSITDFEMLEHASHTRILIDRGDPALRNHAIHAGWLVQPPFETVSGP